MRKLSTTICAALALALIAPTACGQQPTGPASPSPDSTPACANAAPAPRPPVAASTTPTPAASPSAAPTPRPQLPPATQPNPIRAGAVPKHECFLAVARRGNIDLLFVGDSITDFFGRPDRGQAVWNAHYGALRAANFGISGDTTQDVLWRMQNGELDGFQAKLIVLMLGTNNLNRNTNADIAAGDAAIVAEFRRRQPQAKVLILGVFPRGARADNPARAAIGEINTALARLADNEHVFYLDIGASFLTPDGSLIEGIMPDNLHPSTAGYEAWANAIDPTIQRLLR
jgi:lysophospholipase L1-like esterase